MDACNLLGDELLVGYARVRFDRLQYAVLEEEVVIGVADLLHHRFELFVRLR